jgi:hypothetical protein
MLKWKRALTTPVFFTAVPMTETRIAHRMYEATGRSRTRQRTIAANQMKRGTRAAVDGIACRIRFQKKPKIDLLVWSGPTFL